MLVTEAAGRVSVVSCSDFSLKRTLNQDSSVIDCASMRIFDKVVTTCSANIIKIWDIRDGRLLQSIATSQRATSLDFDCNDRVVVSAHKDGLIRMWDSRTGKKEAQEFTIH